jgi:hypothetical protein
MDLFRNGAVGFIDWLGLMKRNAPQDVRQPDVPRHDTTLHTGRSPEDHNCRATDQFYKLCVTHGLTRIRLQFAIYFCLHRGKFAGKHGKLASRQ